MAKISFGTTEALMQATPMVIRRLKTALNFMFGAVAVYVPDIAAVFHTSERAVTVIMGITIIAVNGFGILFGESPEENKNTSVNN